jgi:hypothetical protein
MRTATAAIVAALFLLPLGALAQIPNAGFENWTSGQPDGWVTNNDPDYGSPVTQSTTGHTGSSLQGVVGLLFSSPNPPLAWSAFPVSQRYATLSGWYSFDPVSDDSLYVQVVMLKSQNLIGLASYSTKAQSSDFISFNAPIAYAAAGVPDSCVIYLAIVGSNAGNSVAHVGSAMRFDDLAFSGLAGISTPSPNAPGRFVLAQNYPNPFNPSTLIQYEIPQQSHVTLVVYNLLGQEVAHLVDEVQAGGTHNVRFNAGNMPSGAYFYQLRAGNRVTTRQLVIMK